MAQTYTGETQATEGAGSKFAGVRSDIGGGSSEFVAMAAGARETVNGKVQAPMRTQMDTAAGAGFAIGVQDAVAATTDTGTFSLIALVKRQLQHLTTVISWVSAIGAEDDAAVEGDTAGTLSAKARAVNKVVGAVGDAEVSPGGAGSISGKLRNATINLYYLIESMGSIGDAAGAGGASGTLMSMIRTVSSILGVRLPSALGGNGGLKIENVGTTQPLPTGAATETTLAAQSAKLPATLGQKTMANGLAVTIASDQGVLAVTANGATPAYATPVAIGTTATLIKAAASTRKKIIVKSSSDSVSRMYLGADNTVTAGPSGKNFDYLDPGDTWEDTSYTGAVYAICDTGGSASAKYLEVTT